MSSQPALPLLSLSKVLALSTFLATRSEPESTNERLRSKFSCIVQRPAKVETAQSLPAPRRRNAVTKSVKPGLERPSLYSVIVDHDRNITSPRSDVVDYILQRFFHRTIVERRRLVDEFNRAGRTAAGIYTFEVAETKIGEVREYAKRNQQNLSLYYEKAPA